MVQKTMSLSNITIGASLLAGLAYLWSRKKHPVQVAIAKATGQPMSGLAGPTETFYEELGPIDQYYAKEYMKVNGNESEWKYNKDIKALEEKLDEQLGKSSIGGDWRTVAGRNKWVNAVYSQIHWANLSGAAKTKNIPDALKYLKLRK